MRTFRRISGLDVQLIEPKSPDTIMDELKTALRPGTEALIGGFSVKRAIEAIRELGLRHIPLMVEPSNISLAIDSALSILSSMERKDEYLTTISTTINRISNAVLSFDTSGSLLFSNETAERMLPTLRECLFSGEAESFLHIGRRPIEGKANLHKKQQILRLGGKFMWPNTCR